MKHAIRLTVGVAAFAAFATPQIYGPPQVQTSAPSRVLQKVGISQKMGGQIPLDLHFADESGRDVQLRQYFGKPVILALVYYQCPSLCNMVLNGVLRSVKGLEMTAGNEYEVVAVSFDPRETPQMAAAKKQNYINQYNRTGAEKGWHFLTGEERSSKALADTVGFRYVYDAMTNQYAHSSAIMVLTPDGRIARYFYGIDYPAHNVRLALVEASSGSIGTPTDQVLLYCFHYDPATGKYALVVMNLLRVGGVITMALLFGFLIVMFRRDYRAARTHREVTG
ncbi:MAG: SCO family protein [Bryobacteraceae bacterium]